MNLNKLKNNSGLYVIGVTLLIGGAAVIFIGFNDSLIRSAGVGLCLISSYLIRISSTNRMRKISSERGQNPHIFGRKPLGYFVWALGLASALSFVISFIYLYKDAIDGYQQIWPLYVFFGSTISCALVWGYIVVRLRQ